MARACGQPGASRPERTPREEKKREPENQRQLRGSEPMPGARRRQLERGHARLSRGERGENNSRGTKKTRMLSEGVRAGMRRPNRQEEKRKSGAEEKMAAGSRRQIRIVARPGPPDEAELFGCFGAGCVPGSDGAQPQARTGKEIA